MYLSHFQLRDEPFAITSDPHFLWLSPHHEEAFAHLLYAVQQRKGFAVLTGGIGTGKTTLINSVLDRLGDTVRTAVVYNASLDTDELLQYIFRDFGLPAKARTRSEAIIDLNDWLMQQAEAEVNAVIVVDEAQNLSPRTLEDLRLLSNMETARRKLLQILLVGQPELNDKLAGPELAQLQQRIAIRYHLRAFQPTETRDYVRHRFRLAGGDPERVFIPEALELLHAAAEGVPRVINQICDTALLRAYSKGLAQLDRAFLEEVLREDFAFRPLPAGVMPQRHAQASGTRRGNASEDPEPRRRANPWPWLAAGVGLAAAAAAWLLPARPVEDTAAPTTSEPLEAVVSPVPDAAQEAAVDSLQGEMERLRAELATRDSLVEAAKAQASAAEQALRVQERAEARRRASLAGTADADRNGWTRVLVKRDDTLMKIVLQIYGRDDWRLVEQILDANPFITDPNTIRVGDELLLPPVAQRN